MEDNIKYLEQYAHPTGACFNLTDDCNLMCRYCFVAQHPHYMTLDTAKKGVKWLISNLEWRKEHGFATEADTISVTYFGGEPTLMWDSIIVPLTRWCFETYPKQVSFNITTNGTLLNEERIKFMYAYNITPLLSIDGAPETQDYNRPCKDPHLKSSDLQYKNIPYILKYFPNTTFRATIDEHTVGHTFENYIFAQNLGFKNIFMMPNCRARWSEDNLKLLADEFKRIYLYIIHHFENNEFPPINFSVINDSFEQIKRHNINSLNNISTKTQKRNIIRCGLGTTGCSIGYDGNIYACQEQDSKGDSSHFCIGNLNNIPNIIDTEKHFNFLNEYYNSEVKCGDNPDYCNNCLLTNICENLHCPSSCYDLFNDFGQDSYVHCYWQRALYENAIIVLKYLEKNSTFKEYLRTCCKYDFLDKEEKNNG